MGVRRRLQREREDGLRLAWECAALTRTDKLKPLDHYLKAVRPRSRNEPKRSILMTLRDAIARGAPMRITKVTSAGSN